MATCKSCNNNILSQTPSLIGETNCNQPCPPEIVCEDIIGSNCVFYSGPTVPCPSTQTNIVTNGQTMSQVIQLLAAQICNSGSGEKCFEWENVTFDATSGLSLGLYPEVSPNPWTNAEGSQVKYTKSPIACKAGFQGVCTNEISSEPDLLSAIVFSPLFTIPVSSISSRPTIDRALNVVVQITAPQEFGNFTALIIPGILNVKTTGEVIIVFTNPNFYIPDPAGCTPSGCTKEMSSYKWYFSDGGTAPGNAPEYLIATVALDGVYYDL